MGTALDLRLEGHGFTSPLGHTFLCVLGYDTLPALPASSDPEVKWVPGWTVIESLSSSAAGLYAPRGVEIAVNWSNN